MKKKKNNKSIICISVVFVLIFAAMSAYLIYFNIAEAEHIINNPYNKRQNILSKKVLKGSVLCSDGTVIASTGYDETGNEIRYYPYGRIFCHVAGYTDMGGYGIENAYSYYMLTSDSNFFRKIFNDITGRKNAGNNIITTLDAKLQKASYDALGSNRGAVIVTEPATGKILAMVSKPDFDPNTVGEKWGEITADGGDSVLVNRATQGLYPPGSTFKLVTMLEYIRENDTACEDYSYVCSGTCNVNGSVISCMQKTAHGNLNIYASLAHSCNCSFINMGLTLDKKQLKKTAETLLFNTDIPISIEHNKSRFELNDGSSDWETAQTVFGQGRTLITPLNLALIGNAIANDGIIMKPYIVDRIENDSGESVKKFRPAEYKTVMSKSEVQALKTGMESVTDTSFGWLYGNTEYTVSCKSGSAQYGTMGYEHSLFVSYAPSDNPEISVTVVIEGGTSRNTSAAEAAKKIYDTYFLD